MTKNEFKEVEGNLEKLLKIRKRSLRIAMFLIPLWILCFNIFIMLRDNNNFNSEGNVINTILITTLILSILITIWMVTVHIRYPKLNAYLYVTRTQRFKIEDKSGNDFMKRVEKKHKNDKRTIEFKNDLPFVDFMALIKGRVLKHTYFYVYNNELDVEKIKEISEQCHDYAKSNKKNTVKVVFVFDKMNEQQKELFLLSSDNGSIIGMDIETKKSYFTIFGNLPIEKPTFDPDKQNELIESIEQEENNQEKTTTKFESDLYIYKYLDEGSIEISKNKERFFYVRLLMFKLIALPCFVIFGLLSLLGLERTPFALTIASIAVIVTCLRIPYIGMYKTVQEKTL